MANSTINDLKNDLVPDIVEIGYSHSIALLTLCRMILQYHVQGQRGVRDLHTAINEMSVLLTDIDEEYNKRIDAMIPYDRHAIRNGEPAAGWIVLCDCNDNEHKLGINNKLFLTFEAALKHARAIHKSHNPSIKALRKAE